jgi:hypothetical protein
VEVVRRAEAHQAAICGQEIGIDVGKKNVFLVVKPGNELIGFLV